MGAVAQSMLASGRSAESTAQALLPLALRGTELPRMLDATHGSFRLTASQAMGATSALQGMALGFKDFILSGGRFSSAIDNVPQFVEVIGRAAGLSNAAIMGLSSAFTLTASTLSLLVDNWSTLMKAMGSGKVLSEAEELKELAKAIERLNDAREREPIIKSQASGKTAAEREQARASHEAIIGTDRQGIIRGPSRSSLRGRQDVGLGVS